MYEARVERVRPTRTGHFLSGRIVGQPAGEMALVVSGSVVVGTVRTPQATYTIRSLGSGLHVIRQVDPSAFPPGAPPLEPPPPEDQAAEEISVRLGPLFTGSYESCAISALPGADALPCSRLWLMDPKTQGRTH